MLVIRTLAELQRWRRANRAAGRTVAFVPTMGYLHEGHLTLCRLAKPTADCLAASIFVNPLQFGPSEDLSRYPRDEAGDLSRLASVGTDMVFLPTVPEMYPPGFVTKVEVEGLSAPLCGRSRPGHFKGVATVVARLFNLVGADRAYFGQKDFQQLRVIQRMVLDLGMDVDIVGVPTVREPDGLAMSSRNAYLSLEGRAAGRILSRALEAARQDWQAGERRPQALRDRLLEVLALEPLAQVDYAEVVDAWSLEAPLLTPEGAVSRDLLLALAVKVQQTRLIDNLVLTLDGPNPPLPGVGH